MGASTSPSWHPTCSRLIPGLHITRITAEGGLMSHKDRGVLKLAEFGLPNDGLPIVAHERTGRS